MCRFSITPATRSLQLRTVWSREFSSFFHQGSLFFYNNFFIARGSYEILRRVS
jgi:hypothetical protein